MIETDSQIKKYIVWYMIKLNNKIYTTLCCIFQHTKKRGVTYSTHLQQPYIESDEDILGNFLFDQEGIEEKKELLFAIWKRRQHKMKTILIKYLYLMDLKLPFSCGWYKFLEETQNNIRRE